MDRADAMDEALIFGTHSLLREFAHSASVHVWQIADQSSAPDSSQSSTQPIACLRLALSRPTLT